MEAVVEATPFPLAAERLPEAEPCTVVIFGGRGDLAQRKLLPALLRLAGAGCITGGIAVVAVGRRPVTDEELRARMRPSDAGEGWEPFARNLHYHRGDVEDSGTFRALAARLDALRGRVGSANRLFYCATPPSLAGTIIERLGRAGLASETEGWSRVVMEKPFGRDLAEAQALNARLAGVLRESQVFRIDHYLGKDTVQNIVVLRFGNTIFEPVWNRNYVDRVEITAAETLGVESRADYYEEAGALRDMVTNHLLQLLALIAMEPPVAFEADAVREAKAQVLRAIHPMTPAEVAARTVRAQYAAGTIGGARVPGYRAEPGVPPDSVVETYVALDLRVDNWRWAGVPFHLRTGKRLPRRLTEVAIHFKRTPQALFARTPGGAIEPNVVALRIQPNEGITVTFGAKRPGAVMRTGTVTMDFCYQAAFGVRSPDAYVTLVLDAMRGDATLFTRRDEAEHQWRIVTPILEAWAAERPRALTVYPAGSEGPADAERLLPAGARWRPLAQPACDPCGTD